MTRYFVLSVVLCASLWATACDVCGIYLGVLPNDRRTSVGLFWRNRLMRGTTMLPNTSSLLLAKHGDHAAEGVPSTEVPMTELVNVLELRADLRLTQRFFLLASLPLTNTYRGVNNYRVVDAYGLGDPFLLLRYQLVNTKCTTEEVRTVHRLMVGAGPKFPLGRNDLTSQGELMSPDIQLGTGSWDALASIEYAVRRGRTGGGVSALGRYNTANDRGYQLGHGLSLTGEVFHRFGTDTLSFAPVVGDMQRHSPRCHARHSGPANQTEVLWLKGRPLRLATKPPSAALPVSSRAPWSSATRATMARPRPLPSALVSRPR